MSTSFPCSPYDSVAGVVYFARMLDKIRLHAAGRLPETYLPMLGDGFDGRCLRFLHLDYDKLRERVLGEGGTDEEILAWAYEQGRKPTEEQIDIYNDFMCKRGWRDSSRDRIDYRMKEAGLEDHPAIVTMFDFIDVDEGRTPPDFSGWEPPLPQ